MTYKDFRVTVKKILVILFPNAKWIKPGVLKYRGFKIYEDLYAYCDFYVFLSDGWVSEGRYKPVTGAIDREIEMFKRNALQWNETSNFFNRLN